MQQKKRHTYQIKKTEFVSDKEESGPSSVSLEIIESSCLMSHSLNRNNIIESNNLIYLNGAFVIFYNFFQSNKQFAANVSEYPPIGLAGANTGKNSVAVATQSEDKKVLELAVYTLNEELVPTHIIREELEFIDFCFFARNLILGAKMQDEYYIYVFKGKCCVTQKIPFPFKRIVVFQNKVIVLGEKGFFQFDEERHLGTAVPQIMYSELEILDYYQVDNETKVLLTPESLICIWCETNKTFFYPLKEQDNFQRMVKIGRNILLAHRNKLAVTHAVIGEQDIKIENEYVYSEEKLKGGILNIEASYDQMHLALGVEVKEKDEVKIENFIFNMSALSRSTKLISPFTRMMPLGFDSGTFSSMTSVLSSNLYILIGSKISNLSYTSSMEKKRVFNLYQVPRFMSVHPLSYQLVCGFQGVLKFYNRVEGQILEVWKENLVCSAASYSNTGNLVICVIEDSYSSLILYDCYKFQKTRVIPVSFLKLIATRIEWIQDNSCLLLTSNTEMIKLNISTGDKLSQFRERQQAQAFGKIKSVEYDIARDCVLAGIKSGYLLHASKGLGGELPLHSTKVVALGKNFTVSFIRIVPALKIVFLGTLCGTLAWCPYPLRIKKSVHSADPALEVTYQLVEPLSSLKIHSEPINFIGLTPNNRFLIVNIKKQGYFNFRMRWHKTFKDNQANFALHELGNPILNTIDVTSTTLFENNKEKLKIALEKRKACFNDLEQFRRECELRMAKNLKDADFHEKELELQFINKKIADIEASKDKKKDILKEIENLEIQLEEKLKQEQNLYEKKMLELYKEEDREQQIRQRKELQYKEQFNDLSNQCKQNLDEIKLNLNTNFQQFQNKFNMIIDNAKKFKMRTEFQIIQEENIRELEIENRKNQLSRKEVQLNRITNDLSVKITHCRKQNQRFCNRKNFLQHKIRFFQMENKNCLEQASKLESLKLQLEKQLEKLQISTLKKEQKLKTNIKVNDTLCKFKNVYESLTKATKGQMVYINGETDALTLKIADLQRQLEEIAQQNQKYEKIQEQKIQQMAKLRQQNQVLAIKSHDIMYYVKQIAAALQKVKNSPQEVKEEEMKIIYNHFYKQKKIEEMAIKKFIPQTNNQTQYDKQKTRVKERKILSELRDRKQYIISNFNMLKDYNQRAIEEINLGLLQIQAQNYNLISECNERKDQTVKKKRMLHQLIDSVKETQIYLDEMKQQSKNQKKQVGVKQGQLRRTASQVPFVAFERMKEEMFLQKQTDCESTKAGKSRHQYRRMLDVKKMSSSEEKDGRRIMTATQKKDNFIYSAENSKPQTAIRKRRNQNLKSAMPSKVKSVSKPNLSSFSRVIYKPSLRE